MSQQNQQEACLSGQPTSGYVIVQVVSSCEGMTCQEIIEVRSFVGLGEYDAGRYTVPAKLADGFCKELEKKNPYYKACVIGSVNIPHTFDEFERLVSRMNRY